MKKQHKIILCIVVIIVGLLILTKAIIGRSNSNSVPPQATTTLPFEGLVYQNSQYGFNVSLPTSWRDYTIIAEKWSGDSVNQNGEVDLGAVTGPRISIRHPLWTKDNPRQDIPILIFTIQQWNDMQADKFHIGAAPINPREIGRNDKYVFALPARYNFSYLIGYEEVDHIIQGGALKAF